VQVSHIAELGELDPEHIVTPGLFVKRVVKIEGAAQAAKAANADQAA
jgi:3-oxoadipate CoA-transferase alpha subunit